MILLDIIRYAVFGIVVLASGVAAGSWAIRTRRLNPFGRPGQLVRRTTDPVLRPIESLIHRRGGNPQNAEAWLAGGALIGGIAAIGVATAIADLVASFAMVAGRPNQMIRWTIVLAARTITAALLIRVIGSWFGLHRFSPFAKPVFVLTDWIVEPLRKWVPPVGGMDAAPMVAFILLWAVIRLVS